MVAEKRADPRNRAKDPASKPKQGRSGERETGKTGAIYPRNFLSKYQKSIEIRNARAEQVPNFWVLNWLQKEAFRAKVSPSGTHEQAFQYAKIPSLRAKSEGLEGSFAAHPPMPPPHVKKTRVSDRQTS